METLLSLATLALITLGWHFLFDFGWWQSLFLSFLCTTLLAGVVALGVYLRWIAQHLGIAV